MSEKSQDKITKSSEEDLVINNITERSKARDKTTERREVVLLEERLHRLNELVEKGIDPFGHRFVSSASIKELHEKYKDIGIDEKAKETISIAGRIRSIRKHGKIIFCHIEDFSERIQLAIEKNTVGGRFDLFELLNTGDFIASHGHATKTKKGELTLWIDSFELLSKSLRPLPDEWFGLKDIESRYRQRYADMIMNKEVREIFIMRSRIITTIREFLNNKGFIEIETPTLQPIYGGALAEPFTTMHNELKKTMYLRVSPELYLKRAIVGGFEKVYEIGKSFRNEGIDTKHNPEFTMLEWYWAYADYNDNMKLNEELIEFLAKKILGKTEIEYQGIEIDLKGPFEKLSIYEAIKKYLKIDARNKELDELVKIAKEHGIEVPDYAGKGYIIEKLFGLVEPKIIQPTFITDHPTEMSPLAKAKKHQPELTERFELIINSQEYANAYSEENNPIEQKKKFEDQQRMRQHGDKESHPMDQDFIRALEYGMPPTPGFGLGIDRLVMLFTNSASIRDVIMFPALRE
ncbi:MAG: lysine--tRNA ligase [Candidatus Aenigmarchaeota archaeon]|nr:lysine--tRNA ligase [Candidatus Aenigmarchaeota archaeon]